MWQNYTFFITERPDYLAGSDRVILSYEDSLDVDYRLSVTLAIPATVFIMIDDRVPSVAAGMPWVSGLGFTDTGDNVIVSLAGPLHPFSIYRADLAAGDVTFLQNANPATMTGMYGIAALPMVPEPSVGLLAIAGVVVTILSAPRGRSSQG
jgi:hypothetical protein